MTGPEHFSEAERLLNSHDRYVLASDRDITRAAVHATLALAAVTAAAELSLTSLSKDRPIEAWREVIL